MKHGVDAPLLVDVKNGRLVISIGVETLAFSAENSNFFNPFIDTQNAFVRLWKITNAHDFAHDVKHALCEEAEDGSTLLTRLLDKGIKQAVDDGSTAVEEV